MYVGKEIISIRDQWKHHARVKHSRKERSMLMSGKKKRACVHLANRAGNALFDGPIQKMSVPEAMQAYLHAYPGTPSIRVYEGES